MLAHVAQTLTFLMTRPRIPRALLCGSAAIWQATAYAHAVPRHRPGRGRAARDRPPRVAHRHAARPADPAGEGGLVALRPDPAPRRHPSGRDRDRRPRPGGLRPAL